MNSFGITTGLHGVSLPMLPSMGGGSRQLPVIAGVARLPRRHQPFRKFVRKPEPDDGAPRRPRTSRMMRMWKAGLDTVEIAAALGRTEASVSRRLWIEREALRAWEAENA